MCLKELYRAAARGAGAGALSAAGSRAGVAALLALLVLLVHALARRLVGKRAAHALAADLEQVAGVVHEVQAAVRRRDHARGQGHARRGVREVPRARRVRLRPARDGLHDHPHAVGRERRAADVPHDVHHARARSRHLPAHRHLRPIRFLRIRTISSL